MEILSRISSNFENVRTAVKQKGPTNRLLTLKKHIQLLNNDLIVLGKENHDQYIRSIAMESYLALLSAKTMPLSLVEKRNILQAAFDKLKGFAHREECLFILLRVQNLLCYHLIQLDRINEAREILEGMEDIYDKINKSSMSNYIDAEDLFTAEPVANIKKMDLEKLDKIITNNIQMQAFLYNKLNLHYKYVLYNHTVLRRQLDMKEGTPLDWALKTARLGNYFTYLNQLGNARHHLCAAYYILRTCHDNCKLMPEEFVFQKADFEMHFLELSHHWVKYGLTLFKLSKKKVLSRYFSHQSSKTDLWKTVDPLEENTACSDSQDRHSEVSETPNEEKSQEVTEKLYTFTSLNLKDIESKVPFETVNNVEKARKLFAFVHKWLMRARRFYDFENHSAQYISCSLQLAELYEHLAFFEKSIDNQYNIQKRRADVLETLKCLLNSCDSAMSVQIDVIRELTQVQLELMALNLQKLWREESRTNIFNTDTDAESIINSLDSESNKTLTEKTLNSPSKNVFLKKMEATTSISGKLFRLSGRLFNNSTPSQLSFTTPN